jgi:hypothetical protein
MSASGPDDQITTARAAAVAFARRNGYAPDELDRIDEEPVLGPVVFDRDGGPVTAYRWIGAGRGSTYVQVEIPEAPGAAAEIIVRGARGDAGLDPWIYDEQQRL